jgi:hypothetical protein
MPRSSPPRSPPRSPLRSHAFDNLYFYEGQSALKCGQHALNNLLGNIRKGRLDSPLFVSTSRKDGVIIEIKGSRVTFDLHSFCKERAQLFSIELDNALDARAAEAVACFRSGNYDIYLLCNAVQAALGAKVTVSDVVYRKSKKEVDGIKIKAHDYLLNLMDHKSGLIVNLKASHYVCVVYIYGMWTIIDSIKNKVMEFENAEDALDYLEEKKFSAAFAVRVKKI